jgi:hypothetical protein
MSSKYMIQESDSGVDIDYLRGGCLRGMAGFCAIGELRVFLVRVWQCTAVKA